MKPVANADSCEQETEGWPDQWSAIEPDQSPEGLVPRLLRAFRQLLLSALGMVFTYRAVLLIDSIVIVIALGRESSMISGLFALNSADQKWLSLVLTLLGTQIFVVTRILQLHGPARLNFDLNRTVPEFVSSGRPWLRWLVALTLSILPVAIFEFQLCSLPNSAPAAVLYGTLTALLIFALCIILENLCSPAGSEQVVPIPLLRDGLAAPRWLQSLGHAFSRLFCWAIAKIDDTGDGFVANGRVLSGHLLALLGTVALLLIYAGAFFADAVMPALRFAPGNVKAIFYALLTISILEFAIAFFCFLLDRHRIPVIALLLIFGFVVSLRQQNTHYYEIVHSAVPLTANASALWNGSNERVIAISAQGGGIQAAAWATRVLLGIVQQLPPELQERFVTSVRLMSGVSGGSTGLMFYQTTYSNPLPTGSLLPHLSRVHTAGVCGTGLSWIGYGLTYYDLFRSLPLLKPSVKDRGWGLEQAWRTLLQDGLSTPGNVTMNQLRRGVVEGTQPLLVFNATIADLGEPLTISNFDFARDKNFRAFQNLYAGSDLKLTTAVRLSAAFPYVSPSPRPYLDRAPVTQSAYAITDGGLYDNFGVAGAYFTLQQATGYFHQPATKPILWIQIRLPDQAEDKKDTLSQSFLGPLITLNNTRVTGQRSRADQLSELASKQLGSKLLRVTFDYPMKNAPLSWALNPAQIEDIDDGWRALTDGRKQMIAVCSFLGGSASQCESAADPWNPAHTPNTRLASNFDASVCPEQLERRR